MIIQYNTHYNTIQYIIYSFAHAHYCPLSEEIIYCSATAGAWPLSAERKIEVSAEQRLQMYVVNGSDGRCLGAVRLIVGVRYLERPLREVLLYIGVFRYIYVYTRIMLATFLRDVTATFLSVTDTYIRTHIMRIDPGLENSLPWQLYIIIVVVNI